jgi:hypothetical protein
MYPTPLGTPFCVQETTLDTNFTGATERGRAKRTFGSGGSQVIVGAKLLGTEANAYTVALIDRGVAVSSTSVSQTGAAIEVTLRRSSGALLATADEVAGAINAANLPVRASHGGTGVVAPAAATALSGGVAPTFVDPSGTRFEWSRASGQSGGFFYFENHQDILVVTSVQAKFTGLGGSPIPLRIATVNLNAGLEVISGTDISVKDAEVASAYPEFALVGLDGVTLMPYQALLVACAAVGQVRVTAQRLRRFPYA